MVTHYWGEPGIDFQGIEKAAQYIDDYLTTYGRVCVLSSKEKWGTVRVYCVFGWSSLPEITHPRQMYKVYPQWLRNILYSPFFSRPFSLINYLGIPYQKVIYRRAYKKAIKKWPHLIEEILEDADYPELLIGLTNEKDKIKT